MNFNFKQEASPQFISDEFFYSLIMGYIEPEKLVSIDEAAKIYDAMQLLDTFYEEAREVGLIMEEAERAVLIKEDLR